MAASILEIVRFSTTLSRNIKLLLERKDDDDRILSWLWLRFIMIEFANLFNSTENHHNFNDILFKHSQEVSFALKSNSYQHPPDII